MYDDYENRPEETGGTPAQEINSEETQSFNEAYEQAFSSGESAQPEVQAEAQSEVQPEAQFEAQPEVQAEVQPEAAQAQFEDVYSGTSAEEPAEQEIPQAQAQRIPNGQPYGYAAPPQGNYTGYGNPSYGQAGPYAQNGPYRSNAYGAPYGNPYPNGGYYQGPQQPAQQPPQKKTGKKIFIAAVALVLVFAIIAGALAVAGKLLTKYRSGESENGVTTGQSEEALNDDTALVIEEAPESKRAKSGEALEAYEIAEIGRKSNVGVLIYSSGAAASASGQGSGIVMSRDNTGEYTYIITCAHVINDNGASIKVQNEDGKTYDAELVGYDEKTDVGVIKVHSRDFTPATFGNSDELKVGDPVYAVGNPGGVEFFGSLTAGRVSAINRPISSEIGYTMKCIQHDAAINPGNSGGMLLNQFGQVVGINSQKIVAANYEGMNFSVPISSAKTIIDDLIQYGYVKDRAKLSITYTSINNNTQYYLIAQVNNLPQGTLIITGINSDSSLVNTDAKKYDMIIAVNGEPLDTADSLLGKIEAGKIGDKLTLTLARVNANYSVDKFEVEATLVEDKGKTEQVSTVDGEVPTTAYNPFDYFFGYGY